LAIEDREKFKELKWNYADNPIASILFPSGLHLMDCEYMEFIAKNFARNGINVARFEFPFQTRQRFEPNKDKFHRPGEMLKLVKVYENQL
jgi:predicted alpha/beta-hydrolase family hydrolase